jgi:hypothetical protein
VIYDLYIQDKLKYKVIALTLSEHIDQALDLIEKSENDKLSKVQLFAHVAQVLADKEDHVKQKLQ